MSASAPEGDLPATTFAVPMIPASPGKPIHKHASTRYFSSLRKPHSRGVAELSNTIVLSKFSLANANNAYSLSPSSKMVRLSVEPVLSMSIVGEAPSAPVRENMTSAVL